MTIYVTADCRVLVDGVQNGVTYSNIQQANKEATEVHENQYPHATLILHEVSQIQTQTDTTGTKAIKPIVNRFGSFSQRSCKNLSEAIQKAQAAGTIVNHSKLLIEAIGSRVTNRHTGYNLIISNEATETLMVALPWFVSVTNEDVSNRIKKHGFKLTKKCEVSQLMASFGIWDKYANTVGTVQTFEDVHGLRDKYEEAKRIEDIEDRFSVEVSLNTWQDEILQAIKHEVIKHLNVSENAQAIIESAIELAFEAGISGEQFSVEELEELAA